MVVAIQQVAQEVAELVQQVLMVHQMVELVP
jgi:hypothetical protein